MITVYQISLSDDNIDRANRLGFSSVPVVDARATMMLGARKWNEDYAKFYVPVYEVDADDLDEVFELTNLWCEEYKIKRLRRGSSSSVGDIFMKDGDCYIVDNFGFVNVGKYELGA